MLISRLDRFAPLTTNDRPGVRAHCRRLGDLARQAHIRGTRAPVSLVLGCLVEGKTEAEILEEYPTLSVEGIRAAAAYGATLATEDVLPQSRR